MFSYTVDSSVYALPDPAASGEEIGDYLDNLLKLSILFDRQDIRIYLFFRDLMCLMKNNLWPSADMVNRLRQKSRRIQYDPQRIVSKFLRIMKDALQNKNGEQGEYDNASKRKIFFDNWFHIKEIEVEQFEVETGADPGDIVQPALNLPSILAENMAANLSALALLNKFVYKDNTKHVLIVSKKSIKNENETIQISLSIKKIATDSLQNRRGQSLNSSRTYVIPDMPVQDIQLVREKVTLSVLDAVRLYNFSDILSAFNAAKKVFVNEKKTLLMGDDVERGITEYVKKLRTRVKIQEAMLANALYSYFDALNNFSLLLQKLTPADIRNGKSTSGPNSYSCGSPFCIFSGICKSFVYFLGVECSDENGPQLTSNEKMIKERKLNNGKGGTEVFSLHLKPYTKPCFASDHVLTLRIYFKWDPAEKKILIGWAGRHLFIPPKCPPAKTTCPRRHKDCYPK